VTEAFLVAPDIEDMKSTVAVDEGMVLDDVTWVDQDRLFEVEGSTGTGL